MPDEFDLIATYFAPLTGKAGLDLKDDAACFTSRPGYDLIVSKDLLVGGVHFFEDTAPDLIAEKALAVNVSDLAAKGAVPDSYFLGLALPKDTSAEWLASFSSGLDKAQSTFEMTLAGGDTTAANGVLVVSVTVLGYVPQGTMITRAGAKLGDDIYVTGTLGDSALGLQSLLGVMDVSGRAAEFLTDRYHRPQPRVGVGISLRGIASASADISDGLLADLAHICAASGVGASVEQKAIPLSNAARTVVTEDTSLKKWIFSGGDDYELVFTAPHDMIQKIAKISAEAGVSITKIGTIEIELGVRLVDPSGILVHTPEVGYQHFK